MPFLDENSIFDGHGSGELLTGSPPRLGSRGRISFLNSDMANLCPNDCQQHDISVGALGLC